MINEALKNIDGCRSVEELRRLWARNCGKWKQLPRGSAQGLINFKNWKKGQLEQGVRRWTMGSTVIGLAELSYDEGNPDQIQVGGVIYGTDELKTLLKRQISEENLRTVHEIKRVFEGTVCEYILAMA